MKTLALYIHWPFCVSKCPYCDFASRPLKDPIDEKKWSKAYEQELAFYAALLPGLELSSLYFGGGTPSLMRPETVFTVLEAAGKFWPLRENVEITLEANPSSAETSKLKAFREAGINRLSLGVQSFDNEALRFLGRAHDAQEARQAIEAAAQHFKRFSFDLLYARAGQTIERWETELQTALAYRPKHLSLYQLTIEPGTPFFVRAQKQRLQSEDEDAARLYEKTQEVLTAAGLPAYEISNHAAAGEESRHNLTYWHYDDFIGIGPGAHGRFVASGGARFASENIKKPEKWQEAVFQKGQGQAVYETIDQETAQKEALMMGLRLTAGIEKEKWRTLFGKSLASSLSPEKRRALEKEKLLQENETHFVATAEGRQRLNALLEFLL